MCVIFVVQGKRPTDEMVEKAWKKNDDGGGIAWREKVKTNAGKTELLVRWDKGIEDVEEMKRYCREAPLPFIAHFRIASCGGVKQELTHPFPIDENVPEMLKGQTGGYVLFHNGHWAKWGDYSMDMTIHLNKKTPKGAWSDSRAMAWAAGNYGNEVLNFIGEKCVIFSPTDLELFRKDWDMVDGVLCSNKYFVETHYYQGQTYPQTMCAFGSCTSKELVNGFCKLHRPKVSVITLPAETDEADVDDDTLPVITQPGTGGSSTVDPFAQLQALRTLRCRHKITREEFERRKAPLELMIRQTALAVVTH